LHVSHERWLVSYADFITLLFAFFVVLYASSKADQKKQQQVAQAIDSAFHTLGLFPKPALDTDKDKDKLRNVSVFDHSKVNPDPAVLPMNVVLGEEILKPEQVKEDLERIQKRLEAMLSNQIAQHTVSIAMGKDGLIISLREAGFFRSGSATPQTGARPVLEEIAVLLGGTPYNLRIEGHTDNVPIHNDEFDSNWELSSTRATKVARVFLATGKVLPERLSAAGYAEFHPLVSNATENGRAENRRVDVLVLPRPSAVFDSVVRGDIKSTSDRTRWRKITDPD